MDVFACGRCDAVLTAPVAEVALPVRAHQTYGHDMLPALMEPGTYAVDPEPSGLPWRRWEEIGAEAAEARGVYAPVHALSYGPPGEIVLAPGDTRGTVFIPGRLDGYCLGIDGRDGLNLACARCGSFVATRVDDCACWQTVWLSPRAVHRLPAGGPAQLPADWSVVTDRRRDEGRDTPPVDQLGAWSPHWEAAAGAALAHLLAASAGAPLVLPRGLVTDLFGPTLDRLLAAAPPRPPGPAAPRRVVVAGPELPPPERGDSLALVPRHPHTGRTWQPPEPVTAVPLEADVWAQLAFPRERLAVPVTGGLPAGVLRDDPPPLHPHRLFEPDRRVFLHTLARLPAVRRPGLRAIYDHARFTPYGPVV
ncbi:hypothetical protein [Streptomyces sp. NPDC087270]|uniref:hypothetical protein n=1 Tax=Streptomyces sp. NPDC087270 TaxID=3365774 RepID=UPI003804D2E6